MLNTFERRKLRVRSKIVKNNKSNRSRIVVCRSNKNFYAQLIALDGNVLASYSSANFDEKKKISGIEKAKLIGKEFTEICLKNNYKDVIFDKGAYNYNGRVKAFADSCRESGLNF